jgi:hypothetical protein
MLSDQIIPLTSPALEGATRLKIEGFMMNDGDVSLIVCRFSENTSVAIIERLGDVSVKVLK